MKVELFNEIYGCYFSTVYHILKEAASRELTDSEFRELVQRSSDTYGFAETTNYIVGRAIDIGKKEAEEDDKNAWPFFDRECKEGRKEAGRGKKKEYINRNRLNNITEIPLSTIEKMWLKSIYSDPRIKLFIDDADKLPDLDGAEPLFDWNDVILFDQFADGDPFQDELYIEMFRKVLKAVHNKTRLKIMFRKPDNTIHFNTDGSYEIVQKRGIGTLYIDPEYLEYSERDDKFRLIGNNPRFGRNMVNIATIVSCSDVQKTDKPYCEKNVIKIEDTFQREVLFELTNVNNALERFLLNFSHYEKETEYIKKDKKYRIKITYDETDETDLVIRTLSFGPQVKVIEPDSFIRLIQNRLKQQLELISMRG